MQSALLQFDSNAFPVAPGEDSQTNPGIFGRSLAEWVGERLREAGLPAGAVIAEDFGFVFAEGGVLQRLLGRDTRRETIQRVFAAVWRALESSPDIRNPTEEIPES